MTQQAAATSQDESRFRGFADWAARQDVREGKSSMWQNLIRDFDLGGGSAEGRARLFKPGGLRAYNFFHAAHETAGAGLRRRLLELSFWTAKALNFARNRVWELNVNALGAGQAAFHPAGERFLKAHGLWEGYERFCARFGFSPYNASGQKAYYVAASRLRPLLEVAAEPAVIEVGAGMANLALSLMHERPARQYAIVDLPEMLIGSSLTLRACFPDMPAYFLYPGSPDRHEARKPGFYFCVPESAAGLQDRAFDLALNVDSFQEMTEPQVAGYLRLFQRVVREDGAIANLNRRKWLERERYDNNPLLYPYGRDNRVLAWESDPFMERVLNFNRVRLDGWLFRAERVRGGA